jgi:cation diffusion facilitator CzcD-associated flavoprotein CzcO
VCDSFNKSNSKVYTADYVVVCIGHFSVPYVPKTPGQETFTGKIMHTHEYKEPDQHHIGKNVVVVGARQSGQDMIRHFTG